MPPVADQVVQIAVDPVLDGRPVTTLTSGSLVTWTVGIDKDDGYITSAAAAFLKQAGRALPDDASFPANADHPQMVLHFANSASATSPQARGVAGVGQFEFAVPHATYSSLYLALTSSYGDSPLTVTLTYTDSSQTSVPFTLPDWGTGKALPSGPPALFDLISGLHKWTHDNASVDTPSHTVTGVKLSPTPDKQLSQVKISKMGDAPYLVFWGATGVATSAVVDPNGGAGGVAGITSGGAGGAGSSSGGTSMAGAAMGGVSGNAAAGASAGVTASAGAAGAAIAIQGGTAGAPFASGGSSPVGSAGVDSADSSGCSVSTTRASSSWASAFWLVALSALLLRRPR